MARQRAVLNNDSLIADAIKGIQSWLCNLMVAANLTEINCLMANKQ